MTENSRLSPLDIHFADFINRIDRYPCAELWWSAALASHSAGLGHTCFNLCEPLTGATTPTAQQRHKPLPPGMQNWSAALERCDTVGKPGAYAPLVLDSAGRLYLHRCWQYEQQISAGVLSRSHALHVDENRLESALDRYFPPQSGTGDLQRTAARMALTHGFSVISGGPGTGKTATVARILALLAGTAGENPPKIELAAPTGKAALRLHQSILLAADRLALPENIREALPTTVSTIHRLLGAPHRRPGFRHNRDNPLSCDILVVDEASMVDLQLMAALMEALKGDARLILLGDRDQLASVEAGAVLADICDGAKHAAIPVTQLTRSYRFGGDSGIAALGRLVNSGESAAAIELLKSGRYPDIIWREPPAGREFEERFSETVRAGYAGYAAAKHPEAALRELASYRVLSPLRSGSSGTLNLNRLCEAALAPKQRIDDHQSRPAPLMIAGNNYELGLFNGDIGVVMEMDGAESAWFEDPEGGIRRISPLRLPPSDAAFALTVHKSQGSEFDRVLLILPEHPSQTLSRELLYTAITRARSQVEIWGSEDIIRRAIEQQMIRHSGLKDRLSGGGL